MTNKKTRGNQVIFKISGKHYRKKKKIVKPNLQLNKY
jgi:hypothetical protein